MTMQKTTGKAPTPAGKTPTTNAPAPSKAAAPTPPAALAPGRFGDASKARAHRSANYPRPGHYLVRLDAVREDTDKSKTTFIAVEQTCVKVYEDSQPGFDYGKKTPMALHRVGETFADIIKRTNVAFGPRLKAVAMCAGNLTEEDFATEEYEGAIVDQMLHADQPCAGYVLEIVIKSVIKKDKRDIPEEQLGSKDFYQTIDYVRRLSFGEVQEELAGMNPAQVARLFPDLEQQIADETNQPEEGGEEGQEES